MMKKGGVLLKFKCLGLKFRKPKSLERLEACSGCEIVTDGGQTPDRCVFCHGPDEITWELISGEDLDGNKEI